MLTGVKLEKFASAVGEGKIVFKYMLINLFFFKRHKIQSTCLITSYLASSVIFHL
jgi:hypothetical protein